MSDEYNPKSCSALEKPFYRPIEVAIRWCNLIKYEETILNKVQDESVPGPGMFPQWPCLRVNAEKVLDAILSKELPYGRDGRTVNPGEQVAKHRLTIRHSDLKNWMQKNYPDQKPAFLFDEVERSTHTAINKEAFLALQVERDALNVRLGKATEVYKALKQECEMISVERDLLKQNIEKLGSPNDRAETTYLNIIGGLLQLLLGKTPSGKAHSVFINQEAIISALLEYFPNKAGIATRTLQEKFAAAKRNINS